MLFISLAFMIGSWDGGEACGCGNSRSAMIFGDSMIKTMYHTFENYLSYEELIYRPYRN